MVCLSLRNLLVRAAFKVVPLEFSMCSTFLGVLSGWSSLSESRLVIFHRVPKSNGETKRVYHLVINKCVKLVVKSKLGLKLELKARIDVSRDKLKIQ